MYTVVGMGAAVAAFFAAAMFMGAFVAQGFVETIVPGLFAGYFAFQYFKKKDDEELLQLLNPPAETWAVSLPVAWGCIKDVLDTASIATGVGGATSWRIQKEDDSRGLIQAQLNFQEQVGGPATGVVHPRSITLTAQVTPDTAGTRVEIHYQVFSPMGAGTVKQIIHSTQESIRRSLQAYKEAA